MTKRSETTPGPWGTDHHAEMHLNDTWIAVVEGPDGEGELGNVVAYCHPDNAPVLAAAPALLEAAQRAESMLANLDYRAWESCRQEAHETDGDAASLYREREGAPSPLEAYNVLRSAIAQARKEE